VMSAFYGSPWAILPEKYAEMDAFLRSKARGEPVPAIAAGPRAGYAVSGKTALLPIFGVISQRLSLLQAISGGTSTELVGRDLALAVKDPAVRSIVLVVDSPGGSVFGIEELGRQ